MSDYRSSPHLYRRCKYHIVWTPKYKFKILKGNVAKERYRSFYILCNMKDCEILELNIQTVQTVAKIRSHGLFII